MRRTSFAISTFVFFLLFSRLSQAGMEGFGLEKVLVPADPATEISLSPLSSLLSYSRGSLVFLDIKHNRLVFFRKDGTPGRTIPLPEGIQTRPGSLWTLLTKPDGEIFVLDHEGQSLRGFSDGLWRQARQIGWKLGPAIMLTDGRILASTPESSTSAFEIFDPAEPQHSQSFGQRIPPIHPLLDREENTWVLGETADQRIVALHAYRPLMRIYTIDPPTLVVEKELDGPDIAKLEGLRKAALEKALDKMSTGCSSCLNVELVNFTDHIFKMGPGMIFHLAGEYQARPLSARGRQGDPILLDLSLHGPMTGFALKGRHLAAVDARGLILLRALDEVPTMEGLVLSESGEVVEDASIRFVGLNQIGYRATTNALGSFRLRGIHLDEKGRVKIEAKGYFPLEQSGTRDGLTASPLVLKAIPQVCLSVRNKEGVPVPKYDLSVYRSEETSTGINRRRGDSVQINDPDGIGCISSAWTKNFVVIVDAEGYAFHEEKFVSAEDREIRLEPEGRLEIHVLAEKNRQPVADALARLTTPAEGGRSAQLSVPGGSGRTDREGSVELIGLQPGTLTLHIMHDDYLPFEEEVEIFEGDHEKSVILQKGATLHFRVQDGEGGGVVGANVQLQGIGRVLNRVMSCETGENADCQIEAVPPGSFKAVASMAGVGSCRKRVSIDQGRESLELLLRLSGEHSLLGQVSGMENYPGLSFEVHVNVSGQSRSAPLAPDGAFRIDGVRAGDAWVSVLDLDSRTSYAFKNVEIRAEEESTSIDIELEEPLRIRGRVFVGQRECLSCQVDFISRGAALTPVSRIVRTDTDGEYEARLPSRGAYLVSASDSETGAESSRIVELRADRELDFHLGRGIIRGITIDHDSGDTLDGVLIQLFEDGQGLAEIRSQGGGAFKFEGLAAGRYQLVGTTEDGSGDTQIELRADEEAESRLEIEKKERIRLRLRDPSGASIGLAHFRLRSADGLSAVFSGIMAGPDGVFSIQALSSQPHEIIVAPPGLARVVVDNISPGPPRDLVIPYPASLRVEVQGIEGCFLEIRDGAGRPLALSLGSEPGAIPIQSEGALLTGLPPAQATVILSTCGGAIRTQTIQLVSDQSASVLFEGD